MTTIRRFPKEEKRVESGPVQFGEDWPGYFLRGDNCLGLTMQWEDLKGAIESNDKDSVDLHVQTLDSWVKGLSDSFIGSSK